MTRSKSASATTLTCFPSRSRVTATRRRIPLRDLIRRGPVCSTRERQKLLEAPGVTGVRYLGSPRGQAPVMPLQVFGVTYDLDLVVVDDHPQWDMHEYARVRTPAGPVWLCKDSRVGTLEQTIVADLDGLGAWLPEVPLRRFERAVDVRDRGDDDKIDVELAYENVDGEKVEVRFTGPAPKGPPLWRNSSTMGHSRDHVLAALDIAGMSFARKASIRIGGEARRLYRVARVVPMAVALAQTQAGFSIGCWQQRSRDDGLQTDHAGVVQEWTVMREAGQQRLVQRHSARTLSFEFRERAGGAELSRATVEVFGATAPACEVQFVPPLPDLRRPFEGSHRGLYLLDVGGQPCHAKGEVVVRPTAEGAEVSLVPTAPRWTLDRPMASTVAVNDEGARVQVVRTA